MITFTGRGMTVRTMDDGCEWCGEVGCDCPPGFKPVDECPPMCDCGACDGPRPEVTVTFEPAEADA
jgi:hypothetical protein